MMVSEELSPVGNLGRSSRRSMRGMFEVGCRYGGKKADEAGSKPAQRGITED